MGMGMVVYDHEKNSLYRNCTQLYQYTTITTTIHWHPLLGTEAPFSYAHQGDKGPGLWPIPLYINRSSKSRIVLPRPAPEYLPVSDVTSLVKHQAPTPASATAFRTSTRRCATDGIAAAGSRRFQDLDTPSSSTYGLAPTPNQVKDCLNAVVQYV